MPLKQETQNENKETRQHLLECAKREFLEKGYMKASLRNICKEAGVTTGALYFFFKDKEDLLAALVEEPLRQLYAIMEEHYAVMRSAEFLTQLSTDVLNENNSIYQSAKSVQFSLFRYLYCKFILAKDLNTFHLGSFFMYQFLVDNIKSINYWINALKE